MEELKIKEHSFKDAKNAIKKFSEEANGIVSFDVVKQKDFKFFSHNVTGEELNKFIIQAQNKFEDMINTQTETIKEFGQIYNALESLDKDYINSILLTLKAIQKDQDKIKEINKVQEKTIKKLQETVDSVKKIDYKINNPTSLVVIITIISIISILSLVLNILMIIHII